MRALQRTEQEAAIDDGLAAIAETIAALFSSHHMLIGFSVQESPTLTLGRAAAALDDTLCVADVAVDASPDFYPMPVLAESIAQVLEDLIEMHPEAVQTLRGTTFARTFH
jgi:hypothetical protein